MIKHHPKFELIQLFVKGDLPASLSAGIAMHAEMCPKCQEKIAQLTEHVAENSFEDESINFKVDNTKNTLEVNESLNFEDMINTITASDKIDTLKPQVEKTVVFKNKSYTLPAALHNIESGKTANIGKLSRARLQLNEGEIHTTLLHIEPGGGVPEHTHKGFELTLLLDGSFHDDEGEYVKGDFIMRDSSHQHQPISKNGCLCYTVSNAPLHFTQGINKLLNPIGAFIY
ncbi:ChrR family anti-sigma-E factor [Thalassotalea piscium]|uniref:Putative transcriptional regulator n=1 Tax=Thalassotalea piscium TaxID=1230533 RepID=A0A7X0TTI0_9GAMM|nr:ChrR family anti-sigma-E factor [Thalassotalea piscium]MBB6543256.1 putative transcriptional regulator [Thalassotalea piscium]